MFESLKKKLSALFSKEPKKTKKKASKSTKKSKAKPSKTSKAKASKKTTKKTKAPKYNPATEEEPLSEKEEKQEALLEEENVEIEEIQPETFTEEKEAKKEQTEKYEATAEEPEESTSFFSRLIKKITKNTTTLQKEHVDEIFEELEITLLENNVALEVVDKIKENLYKDLVGIEVKKEKIENMIIQSLKDSILEVLIEPPNLIDQINKKTSSPFVILFFGINGTGKTTSIAKIAYMLKKHKISSVLAAGDTFRAASIEQLKTHADKVGVPIVSSEYGADPASVAFDAIQYAKKHNIKVVLIDTAGRMYTKQNLMKEMEKIIRVSQPDLKMFVGESITGNDAVDQAKTFNETAGIEGIILSKADVDDKAGTILSVSYVTKKPIYFLGTGQTYDDLTPFTKKTVLKNLGLE